MFALEVQVALDWPSDHCFKDPFNAESFPSRIFIIWAISSWFRRGPSTPDPNTPAGAPRVPSRNLFPKDTLMVNYLSQLFLLLVA